MSKVLSVIPTGVPGDWYAPFYVHTLEHNGDFETIIETKVLVAEIYEYVCETCILDVKCIHVKAVRTFILEDMK